MARSPRTKMDDDYYQEQLEKNSTCSICWSLFEDPVITRCHHSFCRQCIEGQFKQSKTTFIHCPICRKRLRIPTSPKDALGASFYALQNLDILNKHIIKCNPQDCCAACNKKHERAVNYCKECDKKICAKCTDIHNNLTNRAHTIFLLEDIKEESWQVIMANKDITKSCPFHSGFEVVSFCKTCDQLTCRKCEESKHRFHVKHPLVERVRESVQQLKERIEEQKPLIRKLEKQISSLKQQSEKLEQEGDKAKESVDEAAADLHKLIDEKKVTHQRDIDNNVSAQKKEIENDLDKLELTLAKHKSLKHNAEGLFNVGNDAQIVRDTPQHTERFEALAKEERNETECHTNFSIRFLRYEYCYRLKKGLGCIVDNTNNNSEHQNYNRFRNSISDVTSLTFANISQVQCTSNYTSRQGTRSNSVISDVSISASQLGLSDDTVSVASADILKPTSFVTTGDGVTAKGLKLQDYKTRYLQAANGK